METLAGILALSIALLVMGFFIVMIRKARQAHATRHLEAENLGFSVQEPPDPGLAARITSLHRRTSSQKLALKRVFAKPQGDTTIYLLDLVDTSGEDDSLLLDGAITIVSPLLSLPRLRSLSQGARGRVFGAVRQPAFRTLIRSQCPAGRF